VEAHAARHPNGGSERTRSERRIAWLLCAPAVIAMLAVTAYAVVLTVFVLFLQRRIVAGLTPGAVKG
jgi:ABC-type sugar transport system permease subunit